ncbi:hypothetical protein D9M69_394820 [compost metagenome]
MDGQQSTFKCECCGANYLPRRNLDGSIGKSKYRLCSTKCRHKHYYKVNGSYTPRQPVLTQRECRGCGILFGSNMPQKVYCSSRCRYAVKRQRIKAYAGMQESRKARDAKRRALKRSSAVERIEPVKVFERDGWVCHLCGIKTLKSKRGTTHPRAPELEHIVALADGGTHTWGNVACACSACNRAKGSRSFGQLGLGFAA